MSRVQFKAKFPKVTLGKEIKLELILTEEVAAKFERVAEIASFRGGTIDVLFGDPQASFNDYGVYVPLTPLRSGLTIKTDASGVVEKVEGADQEDGEQLEADTDQESTETEQNDEETEQEQEDDFDLEFENDKQAAQDEQDEETEEVEPAAEVIGKDELENFILSGGAPSYDDLPYDFTSLLRRKRSGETWMEIASSIGATSSKLSTDWNEYKKRIKAYLSGEEHGAA